LILLLQQALGWRWAFSILAIGPILGVLAMLRLKLDPQATPSHFPVDSMA
jgi:predicted MFS family arabinose efflux permease